ncbi:MAG: ribulose-phosphate 3-epimerase [Bacteroidetes bacterium]|nr:ribulose-phosphate 3-epimerase [Bacteroidota bacterium]MDA1120545.1 ribulose-phosphate 3-epimerase [Bacteroidota bacterium]
MHNNSSKWFADLPSDRLLVEISLWSADLTRLGEEIDRVDPFADLYHLDVADGHFSPYLLIFPDMVAAIRAQTTRPLHVHLMVTDDILIDQIDQFADAGANLISIHAENTNPKKALDHISTRGLIAGVVLQLDTPVQSVAPYLDQIGMVCLLGTRIGVKGQLLDDSATVRMAEAHAMIAENSVSNRVLLAADGAIRENTVPKLRSAGAGTIVMGSLCFQSEDLAKRMDWVRAQKPLSFPHD